MLLLMTRRRNTMAMLPNGRMTGSMQPCCRGFLSFIIIHPFVGLKELGKGSVIVDELIVRADLCDLAICHHHYDITLREKPNPMSHKKTNLHTSIRNGK